MVRFGHADLRIGTRALLLADHERDDAGQVGPEREQLEVQHQGQVVFEHRRNALRLIHARQVEIALLLGEARAEEQGDLELPAMEEPQGVPRAVFEEHLALMLDLQLLALPIRF